MNMLLSEDIKVANAITATAGAAGTTAINGTIVDTQGYDGILMVSRTGAITATAVTSMKAQYGDESDLSDAADVANSTVTIADDDDNKEFGIDIQRPPGRYMRLVVSRGTANAVIENATYYLYKAKTRPSSNGFESIAQVAG